MKGICKEAVCLSFYSYARCPTFNKKLQGMAKFKENTVKSDKASIRKKYTSMWQRF